MKCVIYDYPYDELDKNLYKNICKNLCFKCVDVVESSGIVTLIMYSLSRNDIIHEGKGEKRRSKFGNAKEIDGEKLKH